MAPADKLLSPSRQSCQRGLDCDVLVLGGGIMGLWGAVKSARTGLSVVLVDRKQIGSGASGGVLGALFPWMPDRWDAKKQFQFEALTSLPEEIAALEAETGLKANFRRLGRIIALPKPHLKVIAERHQADALVNWHQGKHRFFWHATGTAPVPDYIAPELAGGGYVHDTLAGRVEPRALIALLKAWLQVQPNVRILEHTEFSSLDVAEGRAVLATADESKIAAPHQTITFSHLVIAVGTDSFPMLQSLLPPMSQPIGQGVKGQAALLKADLDPALPVVFLDGIYVVPHENGFVAVGSTSENTYTDPAATDHQLDAVITKARALVPALQQAEVVERWAGTRPKAIGRDPLIGPVPGHENVIALTGGFKISFGMAHRLADCAVDFMAGRKREDLPENFTVEGQLSKAT